MSIGFMYELDTQMKISHILEIWSKTRLETKLADLTDKIIDGLFVNY